MDGVSLLLLLLLLVITYIQTIHGLISAMIMCVLVLWCTALAFATYEWIALSYLVGPLGDLSMPIALLGAFVIPLIVLRLTMDALVTRANLLPAAIDKGCAAVLALVTAYLTTGVLAVAIQMVPFGGSFLGHVTFDVETGKRNDLWLNPDRTAVSYASMMSNGLFSGESRFADVHPDLVEEIARALAGPAEIRHVAPPESIRIVSVQTPDYIFEKTPGRAGRGRRAGTDSTYNRENPPAGKMWYQVRVKLESEARDQQQQHRFTPRQIRLVGSDRPRGPRVNYSLVAIDDNERPDMAVRISDDKVYRPHDGSEIDFVFEVPREFSPDFIEYMMGARADLRGRQSQPSDAQVDWESSPTADAPRQTDQPPTASTTTPPHTDTAPQSDRPGTRDRVSGVRTAGNFRFSNDLPLAMTQYQRFDLQQSQGTLEAGHIYGNVADQRNGSQPRITSFDVPDDKRLFHLEVEQLRARSGLGRAISLTVRTAQNYNLVDHLGNKYPVVGQFVVADVDGQDVIEIQYFPQEVATTRRGGIREFRMVKRRHLKARGTRLVYLFLVNPGVELIEFSTGRRGTDLREFGLVAPD